MYEWAISMAMLVYQRVYMFAVGPNAVKVASNLNWVIIICQVSLLRKDFFRKNVWQVLVRGNRSNAPFRNSIACRYQRCVQSNQPSSL